MEKRSYHFIVNPASGKGRGGREFPRIQSYLKSKNVSFTHNITNKPLHAIELASSVRNPETVIVAVGGDGTLNEVVNGINGKPNVLGFISTGSGNDFIKAVSIPSDPLKATEFLLTGEIKTVDICRANDRYFINGLGIGLDAKVGYHANQLKRLHGLPGYAYSVFKTLPRFKPPELHVSADGKEYTGNMLLCSIGNGICTGGGFYLTPHAEIDDGYADICMVAPLSIPKIIIYITKAMKGSHTSLPMVTYTKAKRIRIVSNDPLPVHIDGEIYSMSVKELEIEVLPSAQKIIMGTTG